MLVLNNCLVDASLPDERREYDKRDGVTGVPLEQSSLELGRVRDVNVVVVGVVERVVARHPLPPRRRRVRCHGNRRAAGYATFL